MKTLNSIIIDGTKGEREVRKAMKWKEVKDGKAGRKSGSSFMAALAFLTAFVLILTAPAAVYAAITQCGFSEAQVPNPFKTGLENQVLRVAVQTGATDNNTTVTKVIVNLGGVLPSDVKAVRVYYGATPDLVGEVIDPTTVNGLAITFTTQVKPGKNLACPGTSANAAGVFDFRVQLYDNENVTSFSQELISMLGSADSGLPYDGTAFPVTLGCRAKTIADVGLLGKTYNSITITWTPDSDNDNYRVWRQREDEPGGFTQIATGVTGSQYQDMVDGNPDCPPNHTGPDAPGGALCDLSKYAYIVNGYDVANACQSQEGNTLISMTRSANKFQITTCGGCHTTPPDDSLSRRGTPDGAVLGRHANPYHTGGVSAGDEACIYCHVVQSSPSHRDKIIEMNSTSIYGQPGSYYDKNRNGSKETSGASNDIGFPQNNQPMELSDLSDNGVCVATYCHGTRSASPVWGSSSGKKQCNLCHGMGQGAIAWDTEMQNSPFDEQVGAHNNHLHAPGTAFLNISSANACNECHTVPAKHTDAGHYTDASPAEIVFGAMATNGSVVTPVYSYAGMGPNADHSCSNTYCHDGRNFKNKWSSGSQVTLPIWNNAGFLNNGGDSYNCTNKCHGYPPDNAAHEQDDLNCRGCHTHVDTTNVGFATPKFYRHVDGAVSGLLCTTCHGQPPINNSTSLINLNSPFGASNRFYEVGGAQGAHAKHNGTTLGIAAAKDVCFVCHWGGGSLGEHLQMSAPDYISIGFNTVGLGKKGWYQAPNYTSNPSYALSASDGGTTVNAGVGSKRVCSSVYCHSNGSNYAGTYAFKFADWDYGPLGGCKTNACHGNGSLFVATDAHIKHINGITYGIKCQTCHSATVNASNAVINAAWHVNGVKNIVWNGSDPRVAGKPAYNKAGTDCQSIYCHSDGSSPTAPTYANMEWNAAATTCTSCHGGVNVTTGGAGTRLTAAHAVHANTTTMNYGCTDCHNDVALNNSTVKATGYNLHLNRAKDVKVAASRDAGTAGTYAGNGKCSNINCHGIASPAWTTSVHGNQCVQCHGEPNSTGSPEYRIAPGGAGRDTGDSNATNDSNVGVHQAHLRAETGYAVAVVCTSCHAKPATVTQTGHIDNDLPAELTWNGNAILCGVSPTYTAGTCSGVYCHGGNMPKMSPPATGTNRQPTWTNASYLTGTPSLTGDCNKCHAGTPNAPGRNHAGDAISACNQCHQHVNTSGVFTEPWKHIDGILQATGCTGCHAQPPYDNNTIINAATTTFGASSRNNQFSNGAGKHVQHNAKNIGCYSCHMGGGGSGEHLQGASPDYINIGFNAVTVLKGWYQAPDYSANTNYDVQSGQTNTTVNYPAAGGRACSSLYCHSNGRDYAGTITFKFANWDDSKTPYGCNDCHGGNGQYVATNAHIKHVNGTTYSIKCNTCHSSTVNASNAVINSAWHVNNVKNVVWNGSDSRVNSAPAYNKAGTDCASIYCHSDGRTPTYVNMEWNAAATTCTSCHGGLNITTGGAGTRLTSAHAVHANTTSMNYGCPDCHNDVAIGNTTIKSTGFSLHTNNAKNIAFNATRDAGTAGSYTGGSCSNINCHGVASPGWTASVHGNQCVQCHGQGGVASPTDAQIAPGGSGRDTGGHTLASDANVGAHQAHLTATTGYAGPVLCNNCHVKPTTVKQLGHIDNDLPAELTWNGNAILCGVSPTYTAVTGKCSGNYCHGGNLPKMSPPKNGTDRQPTWANNNYLTGTPSLTGDCNKCHAGTPVAPGRDHTGDAISACNGCHSHVNTNGTFNKPELHIDGVMQGGGDCLGCHNSVKGNRRPVVNEFGLGWGHINATDGPVAKFDCGVCHEEGDPVSGSTTAKHNNGAIELRDPDTGLSTGANGVVFTSAERFQRNLSSAQIETRVNQVQNFCIGCHDSGGQQSGTSYRVSGGTSLNPWNKSNSKVLDAKSQFNSANASFHPVIANGNNDYCDKDTMEIPWNQMSKTAGAPLENGNKITCFDCHAANGASGLQTGTIVAHGNTVTLRQPYDRVATEATKLCIVCHKTTVYWTGTSATGSAFATSATTGDTETHPNTAGTTSRHVIAETYFNGCISCHSSAGSNAAQPARPRAAEDTHGYNTLSGGGNWATLAPATAGAPPYAFMRASNALTNWRPKTWPGQSAPTEGSCNGTNMCGRGESTYAYQPGGAF